jgi:hypothetical protein
MPRTSERTLKLNLLPSNRKWNGRKQLFKSCRLAPQLSQQRALNYSPKPVRQTWLSLPVWQTSLA